MTRHDVVIHDAVVVTMDVDRTVVRGWIAITDGAVAALGVGTIPDAEHRIDARGGIVHPGYISAHQHSMDTLGRAGPGDAQDFFDWLFGTYYVGVLGYDEADAARAASLAASDLPRAGVTTVLDCWGVGDAGTPRARACLKATADVAAVSGLRWVIAPMVSDRLPEAWEPMLAAAPAPFRPDALIASTETALQFSADAFGLARGRVDVWASAELPEMATDALLRGLGDLAGAHGSGFTTHLCASEAGAVDVTGERAVSRLDRLGLLRAGTVGAHLTHTDAGDRRILRDNRVGAGHCATSTMLGGGGRSPLGELVEAGMAVGLGLDNATLNTTADMVAEMRHALMFDRACGSGTVRTTAAEVLSHATIEGARALGMQDRIGSLEVGKRADLVVLDTTGSHWMPRRDPATAIVMQSRADDIRLVLVDGEPVYRR
jgi:cytosine/adenosine deaminase-related metal-dependent hydrolase